MSCRSLNQSLTLSTDWNHIRYVHSMQTKPQAQCHASPKLPALLILLKMAPLNMHTPSKATHCSSLPDPSLSPTTAPQQCCCKAQHHTMHVPQGHTAAPSCFLQDSKPNSTPHHLEQVLVGASCCEQSTDVASNKANPDSIILALRAPLALIGQAPDRMKQVFLAAQHHNMHVPQAHTL